MQVDIVNTEVHMNRILAWDIPTRLFHWVFAGSFAGAFLLAELAGDESRLFPLHMLLGGILAFAAALRVVWGLAGSRWARFSSFVFGPAALVAYLRDALAGTAPRHAGHNPGTAWATFAMLGMAAGLALTGMNMATGGEVVEELHELFAWGMVATVAAHLAGLALHTLRHRENIALSMVTGEKEGRSEDGLRHSHPLVGLAFLGLVGGWGYGLVRGYDATTSQVTLPVLGTTLSLGEGEGEGHEAEEHDDD